MTMRVCAECQRLLSEISPLGDGLVTHGLCQYDFLAALVRDGMASEAEKSELAALQKRRDLREVIVMVPADIAATIAAEAERLAGDGTRAPNFSILAGGILERAVNRADWQDDVMFSTPTSRALADERHARANRAQVEALTDPTSPVAQETR